MRYARSVLAAVASVAAALALSAWQARPASGQNPPSRAAIDSAFRTSLHATGRGKTTFYAAADGFQSLTHVPYGDLSCKSCHQPACTNCHATEAGTDTVPDAKCLTCHSRQSAEIARGYSDVHRAANLGCMACHTAREMHGDGTAYASMLAPGAMDARCERCHGTPAANPYHAQHLRDVACAACHMQSVVTCNNCHFDSEIAAPGTKRPTGQFRDWLFLVNRDGKVYPANYQSLVFRDRSFVAFAPFFSHTIARNARTSCNDCHDNANVRGYRAGGDLRVVRYDAATGQLSHPTGVVPVPADWRTALTFDFATWDGTAWRYLKSGTDGRQMLFATPLTAAQLARLAVRH